MYAFIIQARMGGTRFPGKVLEKIAGEPMIVQQLNRLMFSFKHHTIVVAAPSTPENSALEFALGKKGGVIVSRPEVDETDVLGRFAATLDSLKHIHAVVRLTADCPLIDPSLIWAGMRIYDTGNYNFVTLGATYPEGLDFEIISVPLLRQAHRHATEASDREHVTPFIWQGKCETRFVPYNMHSDRVLSDYCWSVDTPEDLQFVRAVWAFTGGSSSWRVVADLLEEPEMSDLKRHALSRPRNRAYLEQVGRDASDWNKLRYGAAEPQ
jgi:spore coat polysaccharide biosynthesis protein SpsF